MAQSQINSVTILIKSIRSRLLIARMISQFAKGLVAATIALCIICLVHVFFQPISIRFAGTMALLLSFSLPAYTVLFGKVSEKEACLLADRIFDTQSLILSTWEISRLTINCAALSHDIIRKQFHQSLTSWKNSLRDNIPIIFPNKIHITLVVSLAALLILNFFSRQDKTEDIIVGAAWQRFTEGGNMRYPGIDGNNNSTGLLLRQAKTHSNIYSIENRNTYTHQTHKTDGHATKNRTHIPTKSRTLNSLAESDNSKSTRTGNNREFSRTNSSSQITQDVAGQDTAGQIVSVSQGDDTGIDTPQHGRSPHSLPQEKIYIKIEKNITWLSGTGSDNTRHTFDSNTVQYVQAKPPHVSRLLQPNNSKLPHYYPNFPLAHQAYISNYLNSAEQQ